MPGEKLEGKFYDPRTELPDGTKIDAEMELTGGEVENEILARELTDLSNEHDALEAQLEVMQAESELTPDQRTFIGDVRGEAESLGGVFSRLSRTGGWKNRLALAAGVIGISLMSGREANAGNKKPFNWDGLINAGTKVATVMIQEKSRVKQEEARTVRTIGSEQVRTERDVTLERERTARTIGSEEIRKERDVTLGALKVEKPTSITYVSGGKEVTMDIQKGDEEKRKLQEQNKALQEQIDILKLRLEKQRLEKELQDQELNQEDSGEKTDGDNQ